MLSSEQCSLIVVDSPPSGTVPGSVNNIARIITCARKISVPVLRAHYPSDLANGVLAAQSTVPSDSPSIPFVPAASDWRETALAIAMLATGRRQLLLCGLWLEEAISLLAQHAMHIGLDVYVSIDASPAIAPDQTSVLQARLIQHGIIVTTTEQALREWLALAPRDRRPSDRPA